MSMPRKSRKRLLAEAERWAKNVLYFLLPFILVGAVWEIVVRLGIVTATSLPPPSSVLSSFWRMVTNGSLPHHLARSFYRLAIGYLLAVGAGIGVGLVLTLNKTLRDMFAPVLSLLMSVPTIAWVPVLLITMGLGDRTVITAVFLGGFFAITHNTMRGVELIDKTLINAARIMGVSGVKLFATVYLPGSLPAVLTGMRLGIGYSWRALVGGEMLSAMIEWGIGKMIYQARFWNDVTVMFVGLMVIGFSGFLLDRIFLQSLERATVERWGMLTER